MDQEKVLGIILEQDMLLRMNGGDEIMKFLSENEAKHLTWTNFDKIIDGLSNQWVSSSNYKVALLGLDILNFLLGDLQKEFHQYYHLIQGPLVDRLGDQKGQVRDASITLLTNIMQASSNPKDIFDSLSSAFSHKVWRVRESVCRLLVATINRFGRRSLALSPLLPTICRLLSDSNAQVRSTAELTLTVIYQHVGEKVRQDVIKQGLPASKLNSLFSKFDEVEVEFSNKDDFLHPSTSCNFIPKTITKTSVSDSTSTKRSSSALPSSNRSVFSATRQSNNTGGLDVESFQNDFTSNLPTIRVFSSKDVSEHLQKVRDVISDDKKDWEIRVKALKQLRGLVEGGGLEHEIFFIELQTLESSLQRNIRDLRSQVVRETCVTVGFLSFKLKNQFERLARSLLPPLFTLIPNSAKVMSTSGILAIRTILKYTQNTKMLNTVFDNVNSRSTSIRKFSFNFLNIILTNWPQNLLEKVVAQFTDVIFKGVADADADTRVEARSAWHNFAENFPIEADDVYNKLPTNQQKLIKGQLKGSSSIDSLDRKFLPPTNKPLRNKRATTAMRNKPPTAPTSSSGYGLNRSRSEIDSNAVSKSKMKLTNSIGPGRVKLETPNKTSSSRGSLPPGHMPPRRCRTMEVGTQNPSLATSRNSSPCKPGRCLISNEVPTPSAATHKRVKDNYHSLPRTNTPSRIPVSRSRLSSRFNSINSTPIHSRGPSRGSSPPRRELNFATPMQVLPIGREGEQALNFALMRKSRKSGVETSDDDFSDASSVCSDRSSSTFRKGTKKRHHHGNHYDINDIIHCCESNSWAERKEGLSNLQTLIVDQTDFNQFQLKKILEIFNKMFADPHGKVFSMFLEMLPEFITNYKNQLHDWLYCLMTLLLKKMGADLLGSVQNKVLNALRVTRENFPPQLQFTILSRYMVDQTQRPNLKVKIALLHYLVKLTEMMRPEDLQNNPETRMAIPAIITWSTETKSADIRRTSEALLVSLFDLNTSTFTAVIQNVPSTFTNEAMKILKKFMDKNTELNTSVSAHDKAINKSSDFDSLFLLSPESDTTFADQKTLMTSSTTNDVAEGMREITSSIQRLRGPSNTSDQNDSRVMTSSWPDYTKKTSKVNYFMQSPNIQNTPPSRRYSPSSYSETRKFSQIETHQTPVQKTTDINMIERIAKRLSLGLENDPVHERPLLEDLKQVLESLASNQSIDLHQWNIHFASILFGLLEVIRSNSEEDLVVVAISILESMMSKLPSDNFVNYIEVTFNHLLSPQLRTTSYQTRAVETAIQTFLSIIDIKTSIEILIDKILSNSDSSEIQQLCLLTLNEAFDRCKPNSIPNDVINQLMPVLTQCYSSKQSSVRKVSCFCLVSLHRIIGKEALTSKIQHLPPAKIKLLQLYINKQSEK